MKKVLITLFLSLTVGFVFGQSTLTQVDIKTYNLYKAQKWDELIKEGEKALKQGTDFFYLRTRLGIAYYNKGKYRKAAEHFNAALKWYPKDEFVLAYLYYSYLYGGMYADANKLIYKMKFEQRQKILQYPHKKMQALNFYFNYINTRSPQDLFVDDLDGEQNISGEQNIKYKTNAYNIEGTWRNNYGFYSFNYTHYLLTNIQRTQSANGAINENFYDIKGNILNYFLEGSLNHKLDLFGNLGFGYETSTIALTRRRVTSTLVGLNLFASIGTKYKNPYFDIYFSVAPQVISFDPSIQTNLTTTFYPLANTSLYFAPSFISKYNGSEFQNLVTLNFGYGIKSKIWLDLQYWKGNINHFSLYGGNIIFSDDENILSKFGATLTYTFKTGFISVNYSLYENQRFIQQEVANATTLIPYNYKADAFLFGLGFYLNIKK